MRISIKTLRDIGACEVGVERFRTFLGKRNYCLTTPKNLQDYGALSPEHATDIGFLAPNLALTFGPLALTYPCGCRGIYRWNGGTIFTISQNSSMCHYYYPSPEVPVEVFP